MISAVETAARTTERHETCGDKIPVLRLFVVIRILLEEFYRRAINSDLIALIFCVGEPVGMLLCLMQRRAISSNVIALGK
jgi:hypothetical protein